MGRFVVVVPLILILLSVAFAQNPPKGDPRAVSLSFQSIAALDREEHDPRCNAHRQCYVVGQVPRRSLSPCSHSAQAKAG